MNMEIHEELKRVYGAACMTLHACCTINSVQFFMYLHIGTDSRVQETDHKSSGGSSTEFNGSLNHQENSHHLSFMHILLIQLLTSHNCGN